MRPSMYLFFAVVLTANSRDSVRAADNEITPQEQADGWMLLFDGKTTKGWTNSNLRLEADPVENGTLTPHKRGAYYLMTDNLFSDFILKLDFKTSENCNSGVFLRADPKRGQELGDDTAWYAFEVAIDETQPDPYHSTGAIYDLVAARGNHSKPVGQWNHLSVTCDRNIIRVELNGQLVSQMDLDEWTKSGLRPDGTPTKFDYSMRDRAHSGFIGLQDHGHPVWFKNIKVKRLYEEGFEPLFDGKSLEGWSAITEEGQEVALDASDFSATDDAALHCSGQGHSYWLRAPGDRYGDFTLRLEYKVAPEANSGVFVRAVDKQHPAYSGLECQVIDDNGKAPTATDTSGAVYDVLTPMRNASRRAGEWNEMEIVMRGRRYIGYVNGFKVIDADFQTFNRAYGKWKLPYNQLPLEGHIGLQNHNGDVWYRNIRIRRDDN